MPALLPPSMQIGTLPPGYAQQAVIGPPPGFAAPPSYPTFLQSAGATTNTSGPTNITQTVTATKPGSTLVWAVVVNASAGAALGGVPTGWSLIASQTLATLAIGLYTYDPNPGGITTVTFSSNATATTGGISSWFWEVPGVLPGTGNKNAASNGSSTGPTVGPLTSGFTSAIVLSAIGWVLGTATFTNGSSGGTGWTVNAQQSSTNGTTNAAIVSGSDNSGASIQGAITFNGTLSVSSQWASVMIVLPTQGSGQLIDSSTRAIVLDQGGGYSAGDGGVTGWSLGGTKPGGAGGGN